MLMAQGRIERSHCRNFERAVALEPDLFEAFGNLGQAYMAAGRQELAIDAAGRALELAGNGAAQGVVRSVRAESARFTADKTADFASWCCARSRKAGRGRAN